MKSKALFRFFLIHPKVVILEWNLKPNQFLLSDLIAFKNKIISHFKDVIQVTQGYHSLMVFYKNEVSKETEEHLNSLYESLVQTSLKKTKLWKIPVLYNLEVGPDLKSLAQALQISPASLIEQHYSVIYQVQFIGFLPGFLYLNGLPKSIAYPRKTTPTPKVSRGSVGIGGEQTGIYPQESPGGWHIIGKTPYPLFQPTKKHPCFAKAGDRIEFYPITESEFTTISEGISAKTYKIIPQ